MTGAYGDGIPIPDVIDPPESMQMTLCIPKNRDHMAAFFGALYQLTVWNSWQQDGTQHGKELAAVWWRYYLSWDRAMNDVECDEMGKCCDEQVIIHRFDPVTGEPQVSNDGGVTWTTDPEAVSNQIMLYPPLVTGGEGSKTKCDAATNASEHINELIDATHTNLETAGTIFDLAVGIAAAVLALFLIFISAGTLTAPVTAVATAIWGAATALFALGVEAFDAYWTADKKDAILCALYCNIGENGQFTEAQYQAFRTAIKGQLPASPAFDIVMTSINAGGAIGLSQMASYGNAALADCSSCDCDITCNADLWEIVSYSGQPVGSILSRGDNWIIVQGSGHPDFGTPWNAMIQTASNDICCTPNTIDWLTGDHDDENYFGVTCGAARWPGSPNGPVDLGVGEYNTIYLRKDVGSNFTAKITFG